MQIIKLDDLTLPTEQVEVAPGKAIVVRGLSFQDITLLGIEFGPQLAMIYARFVENKSKGLTPEMAADLLQYALKECPNLIAQAIAVAADSPGLTDKVKLMRPTATADAVQKIMGLTFVSEGELKKLVEIVAGMASGATTALNSLTELPEPSNNGTGGFVSK